VKTITVWLPEPYLEALNELVRLRLYRDRSEAIRFAVRDLIHKHFRVLIEEEEVKWVPVKGEE